MFNFCLPLLAAGGIPNQCTVQPVHMPHKQFTVRADSPTEGALQWCSFTDDRHTDVHSTLSHPSPESRLKAQPRTMPMVSRSGKSYPWHVKATGLYFKPSTASDKPSQTYLTQHLHIQEQPRNSWQVQLSQAVQEPDQYPDQTQS